MVKKKINVILVIMDNNRYKGLNNHYNIPPIE